MDNLVTAARKKLNLTEKELADRLGVNRSTVFRWEHRKSGLSGPAKRMLEDMLAAAKGDTTQ